MQDIKIELPIIILFLDVLTQCFNDRTGYLLKNSDLLDKKNKLDDKNKIKFNEFFELLKKKDKLFMAILFINSEKIIQKYILSLYFQLFLIIKVDELQNIFKCFTECIDSKNKEVILNSIDTNCKIHKYLNNKNISSLTTKYLIVNNTLHLHLP